MYKNLILVIVLIICIIVTRLIIIRYKKIQKQFKEEEEKSLKQIKNLPKERCFIIYRCKRCSTKFEDESSFRCTAAKIIIEDMMCYGKFDFTNNGENFSIYRDWYHECNDGNFGVADFCEIIVEKSIYAEQL